MSTINKKFTPRGFFMNQKKEDRRVRVTKQIIRDSLIELMQEYPISKISVKMICEAADINRSTFYSHYKDQYILLNTIQQDVVNDVKKQIFSTQFFEASDSAISILVQLLDYVKKNTALMKILLSENGDAFFQNELMQLAQEKIIEELDGDKAISSHTMEYLKRFALGGLICIVRYWLENDCTDSPEMLAKLMILLIVRGTSGLYSAK
jgi:Transcriptional regulator